MEIIIGKTAGFCYGVKRAVNGAKEETKPNTNIYCLGELVHNETVIEELRKKGIKFVNNIEEVKDTVIIRAHGTTKDTYQKLEKMGIKIKDLTCPNVLKIHKIAQTYAKEDYFIILIGIKNHPEAIGTISFCGKNSIILQEKEEILDVLKVIEQLNKDNILIIAQTTYNSKKFDNIIKILEENLKNKNLKIEKTICNATDIRQKETIEISKQVEVMVIVGDKKSSNTNKLYDIAKENCKKAIFVQNAEELKTEELNQVKKIGVMAGASTPAEDIDKIITKIRGDKQ